MGEMCATEWFSDSFLVEIIIETFRLIFTTGFIAVEQI